MWLHSIASMTRWRCREDFCIYRFLISSLQRMSACRCVRYCVLAFDWSILCSLSVILAGLRSVICFRWREDFSTAHFPLSIGQTLLSSFSCVVLCVDQYVVRDRVIFLWNRSRMISSSIPPVGRNNLLNVLRGLSGVYCHIYMDTKPAIWNINFGYYRCSYAHFGILFEAFLYNSLHTERWPKDRHFPSALDSSWTEMIRDICCIVPIDNGNFVNVHPRPLSCKCYYIRYWYIRLWVSIFPVP